MLQFIQCLARLYKKNPRLSAETYDTEKMKLSIMYQGNKVIKFFYYIYCQVRNKEKIPRRVHQYRDKLVR